MARKRRLADLVKQEVERPDLQTNKVTESVGDTMTESPTSEVTEEQTPEVPKYLTLVRKETRLRDDQLEQLTAISRQLNRQRQGKGERITENTLIRIAVDLLLNQEQPLEGTTEKELLASLGLSVTEC